MNIHSPSTTATLQLNSTATQPCRMGGLINSTPRRPFWGRVDNKYSVSRDNAERPTASVSLKTAETSPVSFTRRGLRLGVQTKLFVSACVEAFAKYLTRNPARNDHTGLCVLYEENNSTVPFFKTKVTFSVIPVQFFHTFLSRLSLSETLTSSLQESFW